MNEREKELKFLEIFGEIDDTLILAAAAPQREKYTHEGERQRRYPMSVSHIFMRLFKSEAGRAACAALAALLGLSCIFHNEVRAAIQEFSTLIGKVLGLEEDLTPYAEILNMKQTKDGISVTLKEAILSDNHLFAVLEIGSETEDASKLFPGNSGVVEVDGKVVDCTSMGISYADEDHYILEWGFAKEEMPDTADIVFETQISRGAEDTAPVTFEFAFSASREELERNTLTCDINQKLEIQQDVYVDIERFSVNSIYGVLEVSEPSEMSAGDAEYFIRGIDSLGNPIQFTLERREGKHYVFKTESAFGISGTTPSMESEWIELQFYRLELEMDERQEEWEDGSEIYSVKSGTGDMADAKPIGEKIRIELRK